jgi:cytochrome c
MTVTRRPHRLLMLERALSVAIFVLVLWQIFQSTQVGTTPRGTPARAMLQQMHISVGLTLLLLWLPRMWLWSALPRPVRPTRVPPAADDLARRCNLALYLVVGVLCLTGPFFAWAEGHAVSWFGRVTVPPMLEAGYASTVTLGYLHSATSFVLLVVAAFSIVVGLWQGIRYRVGPWRLLPGLGWSGGSLPDRAATPAAWNAIHAVLFTALVTLGAVLPYRVFGVVPFTTDAQQVAPAPAPAVDPYAAALPMPVLSARAQKDFMWCRFCHSFERDGGHGVGPNLHRVFGRRAASARGFYYSPALVTAGQGGLDWDERSIDHLLADPEGFLDGRHRMRYAAIEDPDIRAEVLAALKSATR